MASRYYETDKNGDEIKPGRISNELRAALNIAENDLPIWIYRMRALGYPPGWLNKAIVDTSDIFDTDLSTSTSNDKSSNKRKNPSADAVQYDHSKLIEYPGFNAPPPPNTVDYHYYYNMPPMLSHQQLDYAKKHMNAFKPAPLAKRSRTSSGPNQSTSSKQGNTSTTNDDGLVTSDDDDEEEDEEEENDDINGEQLGVSGNNGEKESNKQTNKSNLSSSLIEEIKLVSKGSPMPKPVNRLPLEKFSEGVVGELLYFENTPNSSGKFDSIRGLLNTIRQSKGGSETSFDEEGSRL